MGPPGPRYQRRHNGLGQTETLEGGADFRASPDDDVSLGGERIYDGREHLGTVLRCSAGFEAYAPDDRFLKVYEDRYAAIAALREARRWALVRVGAAR